MSFKVSESLHELIKYLSKSEKRYFKVISSRHTIGEENNYIKLFDYIEQQEEYDEEAIFRHFKGEAFLNKFSITKKRLYDHIINALDAFHFSTSVDAQIFQLIHSADILYRKSLYEQAKRQLRSAEKLASKYEKFSLLTEISLRNKKIIETTHKSTKEESIRIYEKDMLHHQAAVVNDQLWKLKDDFFRFLTARGYCRDKSEIQEYEFYIERLEQLIQGKDLSVEATYLYNHIMSAYLFYTYNMEKSYLYAQDNLQLFENNKEILKEQRNRYFSTLTNAIFIAFKLNRKEDENKFLRQLKELNDTIELSNDEDLKIKIFSSLFSIEITLLLMNKDIESAKKLIPKITQGIKKYKHKLTPSRIAFLNFKIATVYFIDKDFSLALKKVNEIINDVHLDVQEEIISFSQMLSLLIHFEMKNDTLIPYAVRNTQRYLKNRNRLFDFENIFLKFLMKINSTSGVENEIIIEELYQQLAAYKEDQYNSAIFEYFDFVSWAKSKIA